MSSLSSLVEAIPRGNPLRHLAVGRVDAPRIAHPSLLPFRKFVARLLAHLADTPGPALGWPLDKAAIRQLFLTESEVAVALVAFDGKPGSSMVIKVEAGLQALHSLDRHYQVIEYIYADPDLAEFREVVPAPLQQGTFEGRGYFLEAALPGVPGRWALWSSAALLRLQCRALDQMGLLYEASTRPCVVGAVEFDRLAGQSLCELYALTVAWPNGGRARRQIEKLEALLLVELVGRDLPLTWVHGDFWPGNLLADWRRGVISGIVDWDRARPDEVPLHDLFHLLAYPAAMRRGYRLGLVVVEQLLLGRLGAAEQMLLDSFSERLGLPTDSGFRRAAALLYWLRLVAANLARYPERRTDLRWLERNVWPVLEWRS